VVVGLRVGRHTVQSQLVEGVPDQQPHRSGRHALTSVLGPHGPRQVAVATAGLADLGGADQLACMLDKEGDGSPACVTDFVAAPQHDVAVLQVWLGRNTHVSTLGEAPAYCRVRMALDGMQVTALARRSLARTASWLAEQIPLFGNAYIGAPLRPAP